MQEQVGKFEQRLANTQLDASKVLQSEAGVALQQEAVMAFGPKVRIVGDRAVLLNTRVNEPPVEQKIGPTDPKKEISVTVMVKPVASEKEIDDTLAQIARRERKPLTDTEYNERFGADPAAMKRLAKFARDNGLQIVETESDSGKVVLKGTVGKFNDAFKIQLDDFKGPLGPTRERQGAVSVPVEMAGDIQGVFGLEQHVAAHSNVIRLPDDGFRPHASVGYMPQDVAKAYEFPEESHGAKQGVAIVEFAGGLDLRDNATYYKDHGLKVPNITLVGVDGAQSKVGATADDEVALDSQVIGTVAPDAKQMIIFAPNSDQGFVDAITRATFSRPGETPNSAISISWGAPESQWSAQAIDNLHLAFKKAALKGISVFAATGDKGAKNGTDKFTADYPAGDPFVTATGGTELHLDGNGGVSSEATWGDSGGGISEINKVPDFQNEVKLPPNANGNNVVGRGVPDVAGNAAPITGYRIRVHGFETTMGGTSAVAPLYAALVMRMNGALGESAGYLNPFIYRNAKTGIFSDMVEGNNGGYDATPGWDAATGWGRINGKKMLEALRTDLKRNPGSSLA